MLRTPVGASRTRSRSTSRGRERSSLALTLSGYGLRTAEATLHIATDDDSDGALGAGCSVLLRWTATSHRAGRPPRSVCWSVSHGSQAPVRRAAHVVSVHRGEPCLGEGQDRGLSAGASVVRGDPATVEGAGSASRLAAGARDPGRRGHARHALHPRVRDRDVLHDVPAEACGKRRPHRRLRHDALHAARLRRPRRDLQGAHRTGALRAVRRRPLLMGRGGSAPAPA